METLKVSAGSQPKSVAGAISAITRNNESVEIDVIGAGAVNQTVKSVAIARGYVAPNGIELIMIPSFFPIEVDGVEKTGIKILVEKR